MKLSETKIFKNEIQGAIYALHETLMCYRDSLHFDEKYFNALNLFINLCEEDLYPDIPTKNGYELICDKIFIENHYKEIL